jgi:hypothetical protein
VIAGVSDAQVAALFTYGDALGIAFQIADDLLDYEGDATATGKNVGDDFRERKLTLPVIKAVTKADATERAFWERTIEKGRQEAGDLDHAMALMRAHGTLAATRADAEGWARRAREALRDLPAHPIREMLDDLADYVVARRTGHGVDGGSARAALRATSPGVFSATKTTRAQIRWPSAHHQSGRVLAMLCLAAAASPGGNNAKQVAPDPDMPA